MIQVISKLFMAVIVAMAFTSCNEVVEFKEVDNTGGIEADGVQVLFSVDKFENGNGSRTIMDPNNGYMLSPLYDKLFDRGFITFTEKRHVILSEFISPYTWKQITQHYEELY